MKNGILRVSSKMYDDITCVNFWIIQQITAAFLFDVVHLYQDYLIIYLNSFIIYEYASNVHIMGLIKLQCLRWQKKSNLFKQIAQFITHLWEKCYQAILSFILIQNATFFPSAKWHFLLYEKFRVSILNMNQEGNETHEKIIEYSHLINFFMKWSDQIENH